MPHTWDPERYLAYADERGRPFIDLLNRVGAEAPEAVLDLGCGTGNLTALLAQRWPRATIVGRDLSAEMIERARRDYPARDWPNLDWGVADLRDLLGPEQAVDVLVSNAALQWVPDHLTLLDALVPTVRPGGWLAFQVPANSHEPTHTLRNQLAAEAPYAPFTAGAPALTCYNAIDYLRPLIGLGCVVDAWETTYLHLLSTAGDPDPVYTWVSGTGARPTIKALPEGLREPFIAEYKRRLREAYPAVGGSVVLPFRRVFVVAQRRAID